MKKYKKPLFKSIFIGCLSLVSLLTSIIATIGFSWFRYAMLLQYESYIGDVLKLVKLHIDIDDINNVLATKTVSKQFNEFEGFLDELRQTHSLDSIVISRPVKDGDKYDIIMVGAGLYKDQRSGERRRPGIPLPLAGDSIAHLFPPAELPVIYQNFLTSKELKYTITDSVFGKSYVASFTFFDDSGAPSLLITAGLPMTFLSSIMLKYFISIIILAAILCLVAILFMMSWLRRRVLNPLTSIEKAARDLEERCRFETNPDKISLTIPEIKTGDELESLAMTLSHMASNVKKYVDDLLKSSVKINSLEQIATKDALTGIRNKTSYDEEVQKVIAGLESGNTKVGVAMIDLNYLKRINDTFGHEKGNYAIIKLCKLVCLVFLHSPVFRIGGDEFAVILKNADYENIEKLVDKFNGELEKIEKTEDLEPWEKTSAAIGYALFDKNIDNGYDDVFRRADKAMYERKKAMKAAR